MLVSQYFQTCVVVITLDVTGVEHQLRLHQHRLQHLHHTGGKVKLILTARVRTTTGRTGDR